MRIAVSGKPPCALAPVRTAIRAALKPFGLPREVQVSLAFIDDDEMRLLNHRYRQKDKTTDVLSFGQALPDGAKGTDAVRHLVRDVDGTLSLGDIVISGAQADRQARRKRHSLDYEVAFLAAHGALHLMGYEDESPAGYREMVRLGKAAM